MSIKYIVDGCYKKVPSHELIAKIEIYLNYICDYEISLEYQNEARSYFKTKFDNIQEAAHTHSISSEVHDLSVRINDLRRFDKNDKNFAYRNDE